ncbi:MAG TPA: YbaK/EbsC family protein [Thermomicrobiales bacterium]|nr:YbaK/EbsC family protein [Thermomicrobiales bacterium]
MTIRYRTCEYLSRERVPFIIEHSEEDERPLSGPPIESRWHSAPLVQVVPLFVDRQLSMLVMRAEMPADRETIAGAFAGHQVELVDRAVLNAAFPDSDPGCLPPFDAFWRMPVYIDRELDGEPLIRFRAGSPNDVVTLRRQDLDRLSKPIGVRIAARQAIPAQLARQRAAERVSAAR